MFKKAIDIFRLIPLLLVVIGVGALIGSVFSYRSTQAFLRTALSAEGEIIGYERRTDSEGEISYFPVIAFTTAEDEPIEFTSSTGSANRGYRIGSTVPLRYDPALPYNATIDTPADIWILTGVLGGIGVVFVAVGCFVFWVFRPGGKMDTEVFTPAQPVDDFDDFDDQDEQDGDPKTYTDIGPQVKVI